MNHIHTGKFEHLVIAIGAFLLLSIVGLWSWNTLADLFGLSAVQYRHILAAIGLLFVMRYSLFHSRHHVMRRRPHSVS
jgi:uncharacterized membrane protein YuzA (DUF378 family)